MVISVNLLSKFRTIHWNHSFLKSEDRKIERLICTCMLLAGFTHTTLSHTFLSHTRLSHTDATYSQATLSHTAYSHTHNLLTHSPCGTWLALVAPRRGTYGTGLALVGRLGPVGAAAVCVAGVALGNMLLHFVWQMWHLWHWAGSGGAFGSRWRNCLRPRMPHNNFTQLFHIELSHT